ncbi:hypothetical protein BGW38_003767 [Lunasporangiospora selenospora]|uniref:Extracellular membrane protein CFEM domain-containing protein n=1 Tax=Lunasporangiospora selenospora TaxID=979761 RepID=A0A9P6KCH3_9FUNG|nr:hypothetical protein BGW38_003767 [Lunasporangiospora selenospora]
MKSIIFAATLAIASTVSAIGPVDPNKLPNGWCLTYTDACKTQVNATCGTGFAWATGCKSTFTDVTCSTFDVYCTCTPSNGTVVKDLSQEALTGAYKICNNLLTKKNETGPGLISNGVNPNFTKPNNTKPTTGSNNTAGNNTGNTGKDADKGNGAQSLHLALTTVGLAVVSLGMAML